MALEIRYLYPEVTKTFGKLMDLPHIAGVKDEIDT